MRTRLRAAVGLLALTMAAAGCAESTDSGGSGGGGTIKVGLILSYTGNFATQAKDFENGFLAALDHRTKGTMEVAGHKIELLRGDDTGDPAVGTTKAKELLGQGAKVLAGPTNSAVALAVAQQAVQNNVLYLGGTSGTADLVGMHDLVFATSGASPAGTTLTTKTVGPEGRGKTLAYIGQDYAFGQDVGKQTEAMFAPLGVTVRKFLLPQTTTDFTPLALQLKNLEPDYMYSSWAGAGQDQLWGTLKAQGITASTTVVGALLLSNNFPAQADALGEGIANARFTMSYFEGATGNEQEQALIAYAKKNDHVIQYDDAVGWHAAEMLIRGIEQGGEDPLTMAQAIKDWSFTGPAGEVRIRGEDNQVTVPGFTVKLVKAADGSWKPEKIQAFTAAELEPPVVRPIRK